MPDLGGWIEASVSRIGDWPPALAYGALALSAFLENILPPVPGDLVVVLSAYLVGRGVLDWLPVYVSTCAGGTCGFLVMYYLGRSRGRAILQRPGGSRVFSPERLQQAEGWLARYGAWMVLANRFLSGIRSFIALAAGLGGMGWRQVASLGFLSMLLWNGVLLYAGMQVGQNWEVVTEWLGSYNRVIGAMLLVVVGLIGIRWWRRRDREGSSVDSLSEGT